MESEGESSTILDLALLRREIDNILGIVPGVPYGPVPALVVAATATQYPRLGFSPTIMREVVNSPVLHRVRDDNILGDCKAYRYPCHIC